MAAPFEDVLQFRIIEQLAVEHRDGAAIFIGDWLPAIGQADNAQAPAGESDALTLQVPLVVRPAMHERAGHALKRARRQRPPSGEVDESRDAAHGRVILLLPAGVRARPYALL